MKKYYLALLFLLYSSFTQSEALHHPEAFLNAIQKDPLAAEKVYLAYCAACHAPNPKIPLGAPRFRSKPDFTKRIAAGEKVLFSHLENGIGLMPARGGCFECDDKLLKSVMLYLLPQAPKGSSHAN